MGSKVSLPNHFPVGTRYVIEGHDGRIHLRYLEFPDGRQIRLPSELVPAPRRHSSLRDRATQKAAARKF